MNILIFDTHKELIQFQASGSWAYEFVLSPELYSSDPRQAQSYINQVTHKEKSAPYIFSHRSTLTTEPKIWNLKDPGQCANIPAEDLIPSQNIEEQVGILVIDLVNKKMRSINDLDDGALGEIDGLDLRFFNQTYTSRTFKDIESQFNYLKKFDKLLDYKYLIDYRALENKTPPSPHIANIHSEIKDTLAKKRLENRESFIEGNQLYLVFNPQTTGWTFNRTLDTSDTLAKKEIIETLWGAGLLLTKEQEALWQKNHNLYNNERLDLGFLEAARQKELLSAHIDSLSFSTKDKKRKI